jgi:hypothetical protein
MLIAQAIVERGLLDTMVGWFTTTFDQLRYYVGEDNIKWILIGLAVFLAVIFFKPRR